MRASRPPMSTSTCSITHTALLDGRHVAHYDVVEHLQAEGKLRVYGVSADTRQDLETVITTTRSGAIEVLFNVFQQEPRAACQHAQTRGVELIVTVPLDSGWLSGKSRGESHFSDVCRRWSPAVIARRAKLVGHVAALVPPGTPLARAAIQ